MNKLGVWEEMPNELYVIGDIHGDFFALKQSLETLNTLSQQHEATITALRAELEKVKGELTKKQTQKEWLEKIAAWRKVKVLGLFEPILN